jgi:hypothetical protein
MTGAELKAERKRIGESQSKFAARLGVDQGTLSRWEKRGIPKNGAAEVAVRGMFQQMRSQLRRNSRGGSARSIRDAGDGG